MRSPFVLLPLLALLAWPAPAPAQMDSREGIALQNQILELRRDIESLRGQVGRGGGGGQAYAPPPSRGFSGGGGGGEMLPQLLDRVGRLEEQVRRMSGQQDELANRLQRLGEDVTKQMGDLSFRLQALEGGGGRQGAAPPMAPPPNSGQPVGRVAGQVGGPDPAARRTPELAMQEGNAALARRDYAAAEAAAREVLSARGSPRAYDAQFLLAQSLAGKRDFGQAAVAYDDTYNRSRTGVHAPDALVGLAGALAGLNERKAACDTLAKFAAEFPNARPNQKDAANAVRQRAQCR